jgi:hypothetical protein
MSRRKRSRHTKGGQKMEWPEEDTKIIAPVSANKWLTHPASGVLMYSPERTWGLLHAVGDDPKKIACLLDNVNMYYRYTELTPVGNWRRAVLVKATYGEGRIGTDSVFEAEVKVTFSSHEHTYHTKETTGKYQLVFVDKRLTQPNILPATLALVTNPNQSTK